MIKIGKKEVNLFLFTDGMLLNIENPNESTIKLSELTKKFYKVAKYKINI